MPARWSRSSCRPAVGSLVAANSRTTQRWSGSSSSVRVQSGGGVGLFEGAAGPCRGCGCRRGRSRSGTGSSVYGGRTWRRSRRPDRRSGVAAAWSRNRPSGSPTGAGSAAAVRRSRSRRAVKASSGYASSSDWACQASGVGGGGVVHDLVPARRSRPGWCCPGRGGNRPAGRPLPSQLSRLTRLDLVVRWGVDRRCRRLLSRSRARGSSPPRSVPSGPTIRRTARRRPFLGRRRSPGCTRWPVPPGRGLVPRVRPG